MSFLTGALMMGRAHAERRMTETVTVGLFTDATDPTTGQPSRVLTTARYTGLGRVYYPSLTVAGGSAVGRPVAAQEPVLAVPLGTTILSVGDEVDVTASTVDASLVGRRFRVAGAPQAGQVTALRYPLVEVS